MTFHFLSCTSHFASIHQAARFCTFSTSSSALQVDGLHAGSPYVSAGLTMASYALILLSLVQPNMVLRNRDRVPFARATVALT